MSTTSPTSGGWTCATCGVYVFHGSTHYCPGSGVPTAPVPTELARIAAALERIEAAEAAHAGLLERAVLAEEKFQVADAALDALVTEAALDALVAERDEARKDARWLRILLGRWASDYPNLVTDYDRAALAAPTKEGT